MTDLSNYPSPYIYYHFCGDIYWALDRPINKLQVTYVSIAFFIALVKLGSLFTSSAIIRIK